MGIQSRNTISFPKKSALFLLIGFQMASCAATEHQPDAPEDTTPPPAADAAAASQASAPSANDDRLKELEKKIEGLESKLKTVDLQVAGLNTKMTSTLTAKEAERAAHSPHPGKMIHTHPADLAGMPVQTKNAPGDPSAGFRTDSAIQSYRNAMILFEGEKYPEAGLAFSSFLKNFADHPLAGSAQFHVGESYFKQREYRLALGEYRRVLVAYDRSSHVPESLMRMAQCHENLREADAAAEYRQMLFSLFPQSPAAAEMRTLTAERPAKSDIAEAAAPQSEEKKDKVSDLKEALDEPPLPTASVNPDDAPEDGDSEAE